MTTSKTSKIKSNREPLLSKKALALGRKISSDPKLAADFLKRAGIMDRHGKLARPYRSDKV